MSEWTAADLPSFAGRTVIVTGANSGLGEVTARELAGVGAKVILACRNTAKGDAAAAGMTGDVEVRPLDLQSLASVREFAAGVDKVDVLINNAGIMPTGLFADETDEMTDRMVAINLGGVLNGSKQAAIRMRGRGGHIVNVASLAGVSAFPGLATYCATKHAVVGFTETLQLELAAAGIAVTAVLPGVVHTELSAGHSAPRWIQPISEVEPDDVAAAIVEAVTRGRSKVAVPPALGAMIKILGALPDGARHWISHAAHFDTTFTHTDAAVRAAYHSRLQH